MKRTYRISDALFDFLYRSIASHQHWIAYRTTAQYLQSGDIYCFGNRWEAKAFCDGGKKRDEFTTLYAASLLSLYQQIESKQAETIQTISTTSNTNTMNEQNFEYLKDNLKYMGFGDGLAEALRGQMAKGEPGFQLQFETEGAGKAFVAVLNFRKSENTDMYFFNSYHATLGRSDGEIVDQAFYLNKGKGVTGKEAFNLLEGRAVYKELTNKEGAKYHAWLQLDLGKKDKNGNHEVKQFHDAYGYDLKATLERLTIRDLKEPDLADALLQSLKKGNLQSVAMERDGGIVRMFVEANPQYKTVNLYDAELKRVPKEDLEKYFAAGMVQGKEQMTSSAETKSNEKATRKEVATANVSKETANEKTTAKSEKVKEYSKKGKVKEVKDLITQKKSGANKKGIKLI